MILRTGILISCSALCSLAADDAVPYRDAGLQRVAQVAVVCKDVEACSRRWASLLGLPAPTSFDTTKVGHEVGMTYRGKPSNARVKMAFIKAANTQLEFLQPVGAGSAWQEGLDKKGEGVHHLGFEVQDLEKTIAAFQKEGIAILQRGRYDSNDGTYVYLDSWEKLGVIVELLHSDAR
jgi:catechol 2,3-dioxygenase-like lactoylglutathione lyase family enzyme